MSRFYKLQNGVTINLNVIVAINPMDEEAEILCMGDYSMTVSKTDADAITAILAPITAETVENEKNDYINPEYLSR